MSGQCGICPTCKKDEIIWATEILKKLMYCQCEFTELKFVGRFEICGKCGKSIKDDEE